MDSLDPRKRIILRAVVLEYVQGAEPVASDLLVQKYDLGVRSATVRNELAEMSDLGYLEQPHTSAGRIPSDTGYRYYVDNLREERPPESDEQKRVQLATGKDEILRDILHDTTKTLSRLTQELAAATTVGNTHLRVRNALVTALGPERALLVVALSNGDVVNRVIEMPVGTTLQDVGQTNEALASMLEGKSMQAISRLKAPAGNKFQTSVVSTLKVVGKQLAQGQIVLEGEEYIFAKPELQRDAQLLHEVLSSLEDDDVLSQALGHPSNAALHVTIGRENDAAGLKSLSILRHTFTIGDEEAGTLAIIGPTRLNYDRNIALLRYASRAISDVLQKKL